MIAQHLESEGLHTAAGVLRNDYQSLHGGAAFSEVKRDRRGSGGIGLLQVVSGRLPAPPAPTPSPRERSHSGSSRAFTSTPPAPAPSTLVAPTALAGEGMSLGSGISLMDALTGAGGVAAAFGSAAGGRRMRMDTEGEEGAEVIVPSPQPCPDVKWDTSTGQAMRTRASDGVGATVHVIKAAPLRATLEHVAVAIVTSDQSRECGTTSSGVPIIVGPSGEDLLLADLFFTAAPRLLRKASRRPGVHSPWGVLLAEVKEWLADLVQQQEPAGGILVLGLLRFFLVRHLPRVGAADAPEALLAVHSILTSTAQHMPTWAGAPGTRSATLRGLQDVTDALKQAAAEAGSSRAAPNGPPMPDLLTASVRSPWHRLASGPGAWMQVPPASLAAAWTLSEHMLFCSIPTSEWLAGGWDDPRWHHGADAILRFVDRYQSIALWAANQVLWAAPAGAGIAATLHDLGGPADRAAMVVRLVALGQALYKLRNFSAVSALLTGLRLKGLPELLHVTWSKVPHSTTAAIASLSKIVSDEGQYKLYHVATQSVEPQQALVPHLAPHTSALTLLAGSHVPDRLNRSGGNYDDSKGAKGPPCLHLHKWRNVWMEVLGRLVDWQSRRYTDAELQGGPAVLGPLVHLLGGDLRRYRFQFDEDRAAALQELVRVAELLEPPAPPTPPPAVVYEDDYDESVSAAGQSGAVEQAPGVVDDDSDEERPWYSDAFVITE